MAGVRPCRDQVLRLVVGGPVVRSPFVFAEGHETCTKGSAIAAEHTLGFIPCWVKLTDARAAPATDKMMAVFIIMMMLAVVHMTHHAGSLDVCHVCKTSDTCHVCKTSVWKGYGRTRFLNGGPRAKRQAVTSALP